MKLPFSFTLKFAFRLLLPGFLLGLGILPLLQGTLQGLRVEVALELPFFIACLILGWLFVLCDMQIYMLFEGRRYWPKPVRSVLIRAERRRLRRVRAIVDSKASGDRRHAEASVEIRRFPIDVQTGDFTVEFPTRLGNLTAAFEGYPDRVYGLDSVFFWPRIWVSLSEEQRREIDDQQAIADSGVYTSAAMYVNAVLCLGYAGSLPFSAGLSDFLPGQGTLVALSLFCALTGYLLYRGALHAQASFGEIFKAVFDQCGETVEVTRVLEEIQKIAPDALPGTASRKERNRIAWRFMHNNRIKIGGEVLLPGELIKRRGGAAEKPESSCGEEG